MATKDLSSLFLHTLKDIYFAENAITKALPKMIKAAQNDALKKAFELHLKQTEGQIARLESIFELIGSKAEGVPCEAIKGILEEGDEVAHAFKGGSALDSGLIAAAQAVEHYEIARYAALATWADELDLGDVVDLLDETLTEEKETDASLTQLSEATVKMAAAA